MRQQAGPAGEERDEHCECRTRMTEHLDREEGAADRPNNGVDRVPDCVDPRNFVREKFEEIENASKNDDERVAEHLERLISRGQRDPVEMNGEATRKNRQVKINAGESSESERYAEEIQAVHVKNYETGLVIVTPISV